MDSMTHVQQIVEIFRMSLDGVLGLWWVTVAIAALVALAVGGLVRKRTKPRPSVLVLILSAPVWSVLFAWMAVAFEADHRSFTVVQDTIAPSAALGVLGIVALVEGIACVVMAKDQRLVAGAIAACAAWFVFWLYFVAAMSISGVWL